MPTWTGEDGDVFIYSFKAGVLSPLAHDLKFRVTRFRIDADLDEGVIEGSFDPGSLEVVCAMKDGQEHRSSIVEGGKDDILGNVEKDILQPNRYPEIAFRADEAIPTEDGFLRIKGELSLHGERRPIQTTARLREGRWKAELMLNQPDFGIEPFRAMMGTLKVKPEVRVEISLPV